MLNKLISIEDAVLHIKDGDRILVGGFALSGCPLELLRQITKTDLKNLETVSEDLGFTNDTFYANAIENLLPHLGKITVSFLGNNKKIHSRINEGTLNYELIPQGSLAEKIRAAGAGLGGVLTKTGIGTIVEEGKQIVEVDGEKYILEKPLRGDVALIKAYKGDKMGNLVFKYAGATFNTVMATAADIVIAEVEQVVDVGEIDPEDVDVPGIFVDYVVEA